MPHWLKISTRILEYIMSVEQIFKVAISDKAYHSWRGPVLLARYGCLVICLQWHYRSSASEKITEPSVKAEQKKQPNQQSASEHTDKEECTIQYGDADSRWTRCFA